MFSNFATSRIINIVDSGSSINMGIWQSAISNAGILKDHGIVTELWVFGTAIPDTDVSISILNLSSVSTAQIPELILSRNITKENDIIVTHGCWRHSTRWGSCFSSLGFKWVYTPHGMLDHWALNQKWLKKKLYLRFIERPLVKNPYFIRAVSNAEKEDLQKIFPKELVLIIPNGVDVPELIHQSKLTGQYLFLGRLHRKKGVVELVKGWQQSLLNNNPRYNLVIAGPDQGELKQITALMKLCSNVQYAGKVYKKEKHDLFGQSSFYLLPSYSEGFPTAVLEAMSYGLVCLISKACHLPQAFEREFVFELRPSPENIAAQLNLTIMIPSTRLMDLSNVGRNFVLINYSLRKVADMQIEAYKLRPVLK